MAGLEPIGSDTTLNTKSAPVEQKRKPEGDIAIGTAFGNTSAGTYIAPSVSLGGEIPIGKKSAVVADATYTNGKDLKGFNTELKYSRDLNSKVSLNAGLGYTNNSVGQKAVAGEMEYSAQQLTSNNGGEETFFNKDDYSLYKNIKTLDKSHSKETTLYGTAGAKYKPNEKLAFSFGASVGKKTLSGIEHNVTEDGELTSVVKEGKLTHFMPEDIYAYTPAETKTEVFHNEQFNRLKTSHTVANINLGTAYNINKNLEVGINGKIPLSKHSDSGVNATMKFKF